MRIENILEEYTSSKVSSDCTKKNCKWQINLFVLEGSVMPLWHNRMNSTLKCSVIKSQEQITVVRKNGLLSSVLYGTHVIKVRRQKSLASSIQGTCSVSPCYMAFKTQTLITSQTSCFRILRCGILSIRWQGS